MITGTEAATPTPAAPPTAMLPATTSSWSASFAVTPTEPSASTVAWVPIVAPVVIEYADTPALTATAALPPTARPAATWTMLSWEFAPTVTLPAPVVVTLAYGAIVASVFFVITSTSTPTPTPAEPPIAS